MSTHRYHITYHINSQISHHIPRQLTDISHHIPRQLTYITSHTTSTHRYITSHTTSTHIYHITYHVYSQTTCHILFKLTHIASHTMPTHIKIHYITYQHTDIVSHTNANPYRCHTSAIYHANWHRYHVPFHPPAADHIQWHLVDQQEHYRKCSVLGSMLAEVLGTEPIQMTTSLSVQAGLSADDKNNIKWM